MRPGCAEVRLDTLGRMRVCVLDGLHAGLHQDSRGYRWVPAALSLRLLQARWGHRYRVCWTGTLWVATPRAAHRAWDVEIEYTPQALEERLSRCLRPLASAGRRLG